MLASAYLHNKFDDKTEGNLFEFQAYLPIRLRPKLNWRLSLAYLQPDFAGLLRLVTRIYGNEPTCDK